MQKPLPVPTPTSQPFWDGLREHRVRIQRCRACDSWVFYPRSHCSSCLSRDLAWVDVSGSGTLHTFTIARVPTAPVFSEEVPQKLVVIELDEGIRLTSTLVNAEPAEIRIGMRVRPVFEPSEEGDVTLLRFEPAPD